ncbi:hypothetical protein [Herbidospora mongoliensis]|uniref:hypothetical protein n=1 Tax=Herbidospora mongoliensis TaxID=688067 RepID=UPI000829A84D|nr:hypothetical protein [Herbidospora mongoliensis]
MTILFHLPLPAPTVPEGATPCGGCSGTGLTGVRFSMPIDADDETRAVLLDEICPACRGCGASTHQHCPREAHAWSFDHEDEFDDSDEDEDEGQGDEDEGDGALACPSCGGRGWWLMTGWSGEPPDTTHYLRTPCGCSEERMVQVPADTEASTITTTVAAQVADWAAGTEPDTSTAGHQERHPLAGSTVILHGTGTEFEVEDWWDHLAGESWQDSFNPVAIAYQARAATSGLPEDNEVIYGKVNHQGLLIHESEINWQRGATDPSET